MGLLDDAIREHLELKRRRGADPGEVAREQHEALAPVDRTGTLDEDDVALEHEPIERAVKDTFDLPEVGATPGVAREEALDDPADAPAIVDGSNVATSDPVETAALGETAELDMRTVLGDGPPAPGLSIEEEAPPTDDSLESEAPSKEVLAEPGADRVEDVLEETLDFLRDTPEQERLWFEQRPPRDFDFDK